MDKECSFLIILIITYLSYNYCSKTVEGIEAGLNEGGYDTSQDLAITQAQLDASQNSDGIGGTCRASDISNPLNVCYYKNKDCNNLKSGWENEYEYKTENTNRTKCMRCIQGSDKTPTTTRYLAGLGLENGKPNQGNSDFAKNYCDALMADCSDRYWYAIGENDFSGDCSNITLGSDHTTMSKFLCNIMNNPLFEFIFSILKGVSCTLEIKAKQLERKLEAGLHDIENIPHNMACTMCKGSANPIPCPDHC